jgi:radical SAM protein with 4Fe4S-binding SPASM domain
MTVGQIKIRTAANGDHPLEVYCIFSETCGNAVALEHNGDVCSCDHFIEPRYLLGDITQAHMVDLLASPRQRAFGDAKRDTLPGTAVNVRCASPATTSAPRTASRSPPRRTRFQLPLRRL